MTITLVCARCKAELEGQLYTAEPKREEESVLVFKISKDSEARIVFTGNVTQEAIEKLTALLNLSKDTYPTIEERGDTMLSENQHALVLQLLGEIATAQPMQPRSLDAEHLLQTLGYAAFTHRCEDCNTLPCPVSKLEKDGALHWYCDECGPARLQETSHHGRA